MLLAVVVVVLLAVAAGAAAVALGVGPFARSAAGSVVFVAISRSTDEADAREIEAIDLVAGTRALFDAGGRITAMVVSADRRSLYVAVDAGRIAFLDATTGTRFAVVDLRGPTVTSLLVSPDGRTLYATTATNQQGSVVPIDVDARNAGDAIVLPAGAASAVLRGDTIVVAVADPRSIQVVFIGVSTRTVTGRLSLPRGSLAAPAVLGLSGTRTAVVGFDPSAPGGGAARLYFVTDALQWDDVALAAPFGISAARDPRPAYGAAATTGTVHVCVPAGPGGRRYVVTPDRKSAVAGGECGPMTGGADILLARRDPAQLLVLDPTTGRATRTLPLAGVPARLTR
jgi:hypothetical protein